MNFLSTKTKKYLQYVRCFYAIQKLAENYNIPNIYRCPPYGTAADIDAFAMEIMQRSKVKPFTNSNLSIRYFTDSENITPRDVSNMTTEELDDALMQLMSKNKDKQLISLIMDCFNVRKHINDISLKKIFRTCSSAGKTDIVEALIKYTAEVDPYSHKRNGQFMHYLAKAQCMRGNSQKGLTILRESYRINEKLRRFYRVIFRELIQDSVLNRSEASMVIFKKFVLEFSDKWDDHYPLVCFWHICWSSAWFSDQMLSNELIEESAALRDIVRDKATAFSISILRQEYNDDAVVRLLQILLKYNMMTEYVKVLQILFTYKLRNRDIRGCTEIIKNCETLGVTLPADQQGKYIRMLIKGSHPETKPSTKSPSKDFTLKF